MGIISRIVSRLRQFKDALIRPFTAPAGIIKRLDAWFRSVPGLRWAYGSVAASVGSGIALLVAGFGLYYGWQWVSPKVM